MPPISTHTSCTTLASGAAYLRVDTNVECNAQASADYRLILACDIPLIIFYQTIPLIWVGSLHSTISVKPVLFVHSTIFTLRPGFFTLNDLG